MKTYSIIHPKRHEMGKLPRNFLQGIFLTAKSEECKSQDIHS